MLQEFQGSIALRLPLLWGRFSEKLGDRTKCWNVHSRLILAVILGCCVDNIRLGGVTSK